MVRASSVRVYGVGRFLPFVHTNTLTADKSLIGAIIIV